MANDQPPRGATQAQIDYWLVIHGLCEAFVDMNGRELAARGEWAEQNIHDALCCVHAIAHVTMERHGFSPWPDCPMGDGTEVLQAAGFNVIITGGPA